MKISQVSNLFLTTKWPYLEYNNLRTRSRHCRSTWRQWSSSHWVSSRRYRSPWESSSEKFVTISSIIQGLKLKFVSPGLNAVSTSVREDWR